MKDKTKRRKGSKDLVGQQFGQLTVVEWVGRNKHSHLLWLCECSCGNQKEVTTSQLTRKGKGTRSCGCLKKFTNVNSKVVQHAPGSLSPYWKGHGEISGYYWRKIQDGAKKRGLPFNLTIEEAWCMFLEQERRCALTGAELKFPRTAKEKRAGLWSASLDRIDSSKGYVKENIQWLHKDINRMKWELEQDKFIQLCEQVINYRSNSEPR